MLDGPQAPLRRSGFRQAPFQDSDDRLTHTRPSASTPAHTPDVKGHEVYVPEVSNESLMTVALLSTFATGREMHVLHNISQARIK